MRAPPPRTRPGTVPRRPEWFYVVRFNMAELWYGYTGTADDVISTEIPERWLRSRQISCPRKDFA